MVSPSGLVAGISLHFCFMLKMQMEYRLEKLFPRMQLTVEILKERWYLR